MEEIFIALHEFDASRLVVEPAKEKSFGKGNNIVTYYESEGFYLNDDDEPCVLYFEGTEQDVWGFTAMYPMGTKDKDKDPNVNMKDIQICYPMTKITNKPNKDEASVISIFDELFNATVDALKTECIKEEDDRKVPDSTFSAYITAKSKKSKDKWGYAVKPVYAYPKSQKDPKKQDRTKSQRAYIKLNTFGKGKNLVCRTTIMGPGDKRIDARSLINEKGRGKLHPGFRWKGVYWGSHGKKSYGASVTLRLAECNYIPGTGGGPTRRMLGKNTAPAMDADSSFDSPSGETDEGFTPPGGDTNTFEEKEENSGNESPPEEKQPRRRRKAVRKRTRKRAGSDD